MTKIKSYYSFSKLHSYNASYNFAVGGRGIGKTYGCKEKATKDSLKSAFINKEFVPGICDQFIYLRRYKEELRLAKDTFFADFSHKFPNWDFRVQGYEAQMAPASTRDKKRREWEIIGYFFALSVAQSFKSMSFPRVKTIIFDEFILEKSATTYLPNEATIFNNFFSTVDRYKDKTKVFFLANAVSIDNPYFIEYKISPDDIDANGFVVQKITLDSGERHNFIAVHFIDSDDFKSEVYTTKFGKFIQGTEYAEYAVGNIFHDNNKQLIEGKNGRARYMFTLETSDATFSVWLDMLSGVYYCQEKRPKDEIMVTIVPNKMDDDKTLMTFSDKPLAMLRTAFRHARVNFDAPPTRNAFLEIFKR